MFISQAGPQTVVSQEDANFVPISVHRKSKRPGCD
jgi:hypothetical protein